MKYEHTLSQQFSYHPALWGRVIVRQLRGTQAQINNQPNKTFLKSDSVMARIRAKRPHFISLQGQISSFTAASTAVLWTTQPTVIKTERMGLRAGHALNERKKVLFQDKTLGSSICDFPEKGPIFSSS
jgi:hypothetical protein